MNVEQNGRKIGRKGISDLRILGRSYILGLCEPIQRINS